MSQRNRTKNKIERKVNKCQHHRPSATTADGHIHKISAIWRDDKSIVVVTELQSILLHLYLHISPSFHARKSSLSRSLFWLYHLCFHSTCFLFETFLHLSRLLRVLSRTPIWSISKPLLPLQCQLLSKRRKNSRLVKVVGVL